MATDYLTCGQCLREFPLQRITQFIQHKKLDCDDESDMQNQESELKCNYCPQGFMTAWALLVHAQLTHNLKIFLEKASKSLLNQVKLSPVSADKLCGTQDLQVKMNEHSTSLSPERDKSDNLCPLVKDTQSVVETRPIHSKMGSKYIVTRNILTGAKEVGEKPEAVQRDMNLEKNATRNTVVHVSSAPQISTSQKLNLVPLNQANVSFLPKLSVVPLSVSSGQIKSSTIKVLPKVLNKTSTQTSLEPTVTSTSNTLVTVIKTEASSGISAALTDNHSSDNVKNALNTSTILLPSNVTVPPPLATRISQLGVRPTETLESTESLENVCLVTPLASKPVESQGSSKDTAVPQFEDSGDISQHTEKNDNDQANDIDGTEMEDQGAECCNQQGCGVTVIPGSHEDLQECCNAVLPKKRKRHMELKHMPFSWSSSRYARRKRLSSSMARATQSQFMPKPSSGTIYIDLEPDPLNSGERSSDGQGGTAFKVTQSATPGVKILGTTRTSSSSKTASESGNQSKPHSLILKPGAIFSIPFTYTVPTSKSLQNAVALPVSRGAVSLAESVQQSGSSSSSNCGMLDLPKVSKADGNQSHSSAQGILPTLDSVAGGQMLQILSDKKDQGTASKPFQCEKCSMAFNQRIHLKKHMSKHTGIKPYKCGECNYSTVERSHLKVHIRIHTGEKPFKCTYCEYATAQNSTLKIHLKRHHGGKMFQCQKCDKQFTQEEQLKGHKLDHGTVAVTSTEQKASGDGTSTPQQTFNISQSSPPVTSSTSQNFSQVSSRYSSSEEMLASQTTNQQQESGHVDTVTNISQSG